LYCSVVKDHVCPTKLTNVQTLIFCESESQPELEQATPDALEIRQLIKYGEFPHVHSDHTLDVALRRMGSNRVHELPVVSRRDVHKLEGLIALDDVLRLYGLDQAKWPPG
jgi:hypothetical protein